MTYVYEIHSIVICHVTHANTHHKVGIIVIIWASVGHFIHVRTFSSICS